MKGVTQCIVAGQPHLLEGHLFQVRTSVSSLSCSHMDSKAAAWNVNSDPSVAHDCLSVGMDALQNSAS